jgi:dCMP deaminase
MERDRPSFPHIYMSLARALSERSSCSRAQVGTVITSIDFRKVLAVGYSGNATGLPNRCDHDEDAALDCGCLHSEENAVIHCDAPRGEPKIVFVTELPCRACAKRIIQLGGVVDLYFGKGQGDPQHAGGPMRLLTSVGVRVHRLED